MTCQSLVYEYVQPVKLFFDQLYIIIFKSWLQKKYHRRDSLKDAILLPLSVVLLFWIIMNSAMTKVNYGMIDADYDLRPLPPFEASNGGVFDPLTKFNKNGPPMMYTIVYSPSNHTGINILMEGLQSKWPMLDVTGVDDIKDYFDYNLYSVLYGVEFKLTNEQCISDEIVPSSTSNTVKYTVRPNPAISTNTAFYDYFVFNDLASSSDYWLNYGYLTLQNYLQVHIARQAHPNSNDVPPKLTNFDVSTHAKRYPKSSVYEDSFTVTIAYVRWMLWKWLAAPFFSIVCIVPMLSSLTQIVKEREGKMLALLEISGLTPIALVMGYYIFIFAITQLAYVLSVLIFHAADIMTDFTYVYYYHLVCMYILAFIPQAMCIGFVIHKYEYFGLPIFIYNIGLAIAGDFIANAPSISKEGKGFLIFIMPTTGLSIGAFSIESLAYHHQDETLDWAYTDESKQLPSPDAVLAILFFSAVFWLFIWWGIPFTWLNRWVDMAAVYCPWIGNSAQLVSIEEPPTDAIPSTAGHFEEVGGLNDKFNGGKVLLSIRNVSHIYPDGTAAVKAVSFDVRAGEVLSYLGSNGAGKSTTMGMLCGTLPITKGEILINGHSIENDKVLARRSLGICSQQDILWEDISVEDHLYIFGMIRGMNSDSLKTAVSQMIADLGFPEKAKSLSGTLSGGQKRRLCAGIAMIGGNKVVLLDEPTAGLDPVSRRQLWQLVQKNRAGKAILLTTHFMDEADILGDRMLILKDGSVKALGSSAFLKNTFGVGYIIKFSTFTELNSKQIADIVSKVNSHIADSSLMSSAGTELILRLSKASVSLFPNMLEDIEVHASTLMISSFGIETTKLEEVFMKIVGENSSSADATSSQSSIHNQANQTSSSVHPVTSRPLEVELLLEKGNYDLEETFCQSLCNRLSPCRSFVTLFMLLKKRFLQFARSRGQFVMGIILPLLMVILISSLQKSMPSDLFLPEPSAIQLSSAYAVGAVVDIANVSTPVAAVTAENALLFDQDAFYDTCPTCDLEEGFRYVGDSSNDIYYGYIKSAADNVVNGSTNGVYYEQQNNFNVYYNASYPFNFAASVSSLLAGAITNATAATLSFVEFYQPFPGNKLDAQLNAVGYSSLCMGIFSGSIGSGLSIVLGSERVNGVKHLQISSGASKLSYWVANFFWDFAIAYYNVVVLCVALAIALPVFFGGDQFPIMLIGGLFYTAVAISRFHILSFVIADIKVAQTVYFYFTTFITYIIVSVYFGIVLNGGPVNLLSPMAYYSANFMAIIEPSFGLSMIMNYQHNFLSVRTQNGNVTGLYCGLLILISFGFTFIAQLIILYFMEFGFSDFINKLFSCFETKFVIIRTQMHRNIEWDIVSEDQIRRHPDSRDVASANAEANNDGASSFLVGGARDDRKVEVQFINLNSNAIAIGIESLEDSDVVDEKKRVQLVLDKGTIRVDSHTIIDSKINKIYFGRGSVPTKIAVKDVSVSVPCGEIFGLLGANGAGKSTLIKIMSGLEYPSSGKCLINGYDVVREKAFAQRSMGLCPQFDTLIDRLSVIENLHFFANIKGVPRSKVKAVCDAYLCALDIKKYQNKLTMHLSGGNRRKLSLAVALIGSPPTVYLDEPSTGLDPVASRHMWRLLNKVSTAKKSAIVLTTHNMAECEACCHRITIMKQGEFSCIGNSQHLRSKHGTGYMLELVVESKERLGAATSFVMASFANAVVVDSHANMINFEVPKSSIKSLSSAFRTMETNKVTCGISDYSLSQSSLEQVFLKTIRPAEADGVLIDEEVVVETPTEE